MEGEAWLPPLNLHQDWEITATLSQKEEPYIYLSKHLPYFSFEINVTATFGSDKPTNSDMFKGLNMAETYVIPCCLLTTMENAKEQIKAMLAYASIPFPLQQIKFRHIRLDASVTPTHPTLMDEDSLLQEICSNMFRIMEELPRYPECNVIPLKLSILKRITIPDSEMLAWSSRYKRMVDNFPNFETTYNTRIARTRWKYEDEYVQTITASRMANPAASEAHPDVARPDSETT